MSESLQEKIRLIKEFRKVTEQEAREIAERLLSKPDDVYEVDFGWVKLHFRRMSYADRDSYLLLVRQLDPEKQNEELADQLIAKAAELLAKYNEDGQTKETWLKMARSDREPEFERIFLHLLAISSFPEEPVKFFRELDNRKQLGGS